MQGFVLLPVLVYAAQELWYLGWLSVLAGCVTLSLVFVLLLPSAPVNVHAGGVQTWSEHVEL